MSARLVADKRAEQRARVVDVLALLRLEGQLVASKSIDVPTR